MQPATKQQLNARIEEMVSEYSLPLLKRQWQIAELILGDEGVRAFYAIGEAGYGNVAILTDNLVVDVESREAANFGNVNFESLAGVAGVSIAGGMAEHSAVPFSTGAKLGVTARGQGLLTGLYWFAKTEQQVEELKQFSRLLLDAIKSRP